MQLRNRYIFKSVDAVFRACISDQTYCCFYTPSPVLYRKPDISFCACSSNFNAKGQFAALIAEATEVSGKKVSSEEETFSDLSNLIFFNNFLVGHKFLAATAITADQLGDSCCRHM